MIDTKKVSLHTLLVALFIGGATYFTAPSGTTEQQKREQAGTVAIMSLFGVAPVSAANTQRKTKKRDN